MEINDDKDYVIAESIKSILPYRPTEYLQDLRDCVIETLDERMV